MTSAARAGASRREGWLDALRVLAAFGVIVNHTNSKVFQALTPQDAQWWLSVGWYYVSKLAVPLFVMVSGACLLPRRDSPRRVLGRMARILGALLLFSYAYYLYDAWVYWGLWPRMADLGTFLRLVWTQQITDSFWYLTFYLALLAMLPFLQRLASALSGRGVAALAGICLLWDGLWPLAAHYVPAISPPAYLDAPLFTVYVGLFFAGYWLRRFFSPTRGRMRLAWAVLAASLLASVLLTFVEYGRPHASLAAHGHERRFGHGAYARRALAEAPRARPDGAGGLRFRHLSGAGLADCPDAGAAVPAAVRRAAFSCGGAGLGAGGIRAGAGRRMADAPCAGAAQNCIGTMPSDGRAPAQSAGARYSVSKESGCAGLFDTLCPPPIGAAGADRWGGGRRPLRKGPLPPGNSPFNA